MPRLEPKIVQKELEQGQLWPVYWLYGHEKMKSRELLKRIRKAVLGEAGDPGANALLGLAEETLDGHEVDAATVVDAAQSPSLGGGVRFIVIRDAHALKNSEVLSALLGARTKKEELTSVCVFLSKDLDGRKKFSKTLVDKAAVVPCEDVSESEREAWVQYLAKRRGFEKALPPELVLVLCTLDPWSLDIVDQELEKYSLTSADPDVILQSAGSFGALGGADAFLHAFFSRDLGAALRAVDLFADRPDEALPLLGLFAWNVRQLALLVADRENGTRNAKLNPYVAERMRVWSARWTLDEVIALQQKLMEVDFGFKQTPLLPLGLWNSVVTEFCRPA